jgi:hypothetical protein
MNEVFRQHIETLQQSLRQLLDTPPAKLDKLPRNMPERGVYLLSEEGRYLYAGRSNQIKQRLRAHASRSHRKAAFAFRLAREETGRKRPTYKPQGSREALMRDPAFAAAFARALSRIRRMEVRFIEEADPTRQALLEIYVATALGTPYNDFDTH